MLRCLAQSSRQALRFYSAQASTLTPELKARIDGFIKADPVVVFMKGTQDQPMCGFSKNVKLVLDFHHVKFKDYNVLEDPALREGVKDTTQVYVRGEFVGGCDIIVQMHKDGEISDFLNSKNIPNKFGSAKDAA